MTSSNLKTFHVHFGTWTCYGLKIEAADEDAAIARAEALYEQEGEHAFDVDMTGSDPFDAYQIGGRQ